MDHSGGAMRMLRTAWSLVSESVAAWWNDNTFRLSASLAFYTVFSLAPILVIAIAVAGWVFGREAATGQVVEQFRGLIGNDGAKAVQEMLRGAGTSRHTPLATAVSIATLVIGSTAVFVELQSALDKIWGVEPAPQSGMVLRLVLQRLLSLAIVAGVGFLMLVSLLVSAAITASQHYLEGSLGGQTWVWRVISAVVSLGAGWVLFGMIYKVLPDVRLRWKDVAVGAAVTSVLFGGGKYVIGLYLGQAAIGSTFGAAGSLAVVLMWVYYSALVSFLGAEFTKVYARRLGSGLRPTEQARRIGHNSEP